MRIRDCRSDVASSDLRLAADCLHLAVQAEALDLAPQQFAYHQGARRVGPRLRRIHRPMELHLAADIDFGDRGVADEQPAGPRLSQRPRPFVASAAGWSCPSAAPGLPEPMT